MTRIDDLNTFIIDMTQEKGNRFRMNGEPIDISHIQTMDIHIEGGQVQIRTTELKNMRLGSAGM